MKRIAMQEAVKLSLRITSRGTSAWHPSLPCRRLLHVHEPVGDADREERDRHVEEEDPAPAQLLGEGAAEERADGVAEPGGADDDPAGEARLLFGQQLVGHADAHCEEGEPVGPLAWAEQAPGLRFAQLR
jgi:hypothetical protein